MLTISKEMVFIISISKTCIFCTKRKKGESLLFRILFISYHLKNHQNFIDVITKENSISRLLFAPTYNVSKLWYWVVEEHKWSLYLHFDWVLTKYSPNFRINLSQITEKNRPFLPNIKLINYLCSSKCFNLWMVTDIE